MADDSDSTTAGGPVTGGPAVAAAASNIAGQQAIAQQLFGPQAATPQNPPASTPAPLWNRAMAAPPTVAPAAPQTPATAPEPENRGARIYHGILGALGGTQDAVLTTDPQTGQVKVSQVASTPGSQWKRIIAGALAGLAGTANAGTGPGAMSRAAAGGVQGGINLARERQQIPEQQAKEQTQENQETMLANARNAIMTQERSAMDFELTRKGVESRYLDNDRMNAFMQNIIEDGGMDLGVFQSAAEAMQHANQDPTAVQMLAHGRLMMMPQIDENNKYAGNHYAIQPEGYDTQQITGDMPMPRILPPTKPGEDYTVKWETIPANTPGMTNAKYNTLFAAQIGFLEKLDHSRMQQTEAMAKTVTKQGPDGKAHVFGWNPTTGNFDRDQGVAEKAPPAVVNVGEKLSDLDRLGTRLSKPYEKGSEAASGQLDKITDARAMIGGNAEAQALGIPKVLTALVSGQGTGVRITTPELNAIAHARGIVGDFEGWINSISGQGKLSKDQKAQLIGVLDDAKKRILLKEQIHNEALDAINGAGSREDIITADRTARNRLMQLERGQTLPAAPAGGGAPPATPSTLPAGATQPGGGGGFDWNAQKDHKPAGAP